MKHAFITLIGLLALAVPALAQQDPDDPGMQDSLIIGQVLVDSGQGFAFVPIYIVTDDSVGYYNTPISWNAPDGGVHPGIGSQYFPPYNCWDNFDTIMTNPPYIRHIGFFGGEDCPYMNTHGERYNIWTIRFIISRNSPRQLVVLDTAWDDRNGSILLGLSDGLSEITPAFVRGYIGYGVGVDSDVETEPKNISLSQNYPNPFNSATEIQFSLPSPGPASLVIYDIQGREVRTLFDGTFEAGAHSVIWDGLNDDNRPVSSGVYFYSLKSGDNIAKNRMTLLR
jgi:hypothetical protein